MTKIGIIGTGMLGKAVGLHLLESKIELTVYNRTKEKTKLLKEKGAEVADSPKEVAQKSDLVITIVKDAKALKTVAFAEDGILHGKHDGLSIADMSTINPLDSKKIAKRFEKNGIKMLDIPVMGGPKVAITGNLVLMASGNKEIFNKFQSIFDTIAHKTFYLGKSGTAHSVKLAMNLQISMLALALSEGITLSRALSVHPKVFLEILNSTYFKTGMSENKAFKMIEDKFEPTFTLKNLKKDLHTINEVVRSFGFQLPMASQAEEIYAKAIASGFGELDYTGILSYIKDSVERKLAKIDLNP